MLVFGVYTPHAFSFSFLIRERLFTGVCGLCVGGLTILFLPTVSKQPKQLKAWSVLFLACPWSFSPAGLAADGEAINVHRSCPRRLLVRSFVCFVSACGPLCTHNNAVGATLPFLQLVPGKPQLGVRSAFRWSLSARIRLPLLHVRDHWYVITKMNRLLAFVVFYTRFADG